MRRGGKETEAEAEALSEDLPPRPLENADAMERITFVKPSQSVPSVED